MEPEVSLPCSQGPSTCPYPEPNQSSPCKYFLVILQLNSIQSQFSPLHILETLSPQIHFNNIFDLRLSRRWLWPCRLIIFFFLHLLFDLEGGGDIFLRIFGLSPKLYGVTAHFNIILQSVVKFAMLYFQKIFYSQTLYISLVSRIHNIYATHLIRLHLIYITLDV
jgi:hypothetical protein